MNYAQAAQLARATEGVAQIDALAARVAELERRLDAAESRRRTRKPRQPEPETTEEAPWPTR